MTSERLHAFVSGEVQGVFFRDLVRQSATNLQITGWVKNTPDGMVEFIAEGPRKMLEQLLTICKKGNTNAKVENIKTTWSKATGEYTKFTIQY